eukprot:gene40568-53648_t
MPQPFHNNTEILDRMYPLKVFNSLTRTKVRFIPKDPSRVLWYQCGPTVYAESHIGHARTYVSLDVIRRIAKDYLGYNIVLCQNVTDIDDKIIIRSYEQGIPFRDLASKFEAEFFEDMAALGVQLPDLITRVSEYMPEILSYIDDLIKKGIAYEANGSVYFNTAQFQACGHKYGKLLPEQIGNSDLLAEGEGALTANDDKKNPSDFVLWKKMKTHENGMVEPSWESPWGAGRPGWHIECSAMSERYLGQVFDIHAGGLDLIFPHHENEIAQSCCAFDNDLMATVWMHNGFLQVEGRKMSKSEGNFVTINELLATEKFGGRKWPGEVLRLAMLMTHYREPIDFSVKRLEEAERLLAKWPAGDAGSAAPDRTVIEALSDDLNTVAAVQALHVLAQAANADPAKLPLFVASAALLGIAPKKTEVSDDLSAAVQSLVDLRLEMLKTKNFAEADRIRDELGEKGIQLKDGKDKETGER